MSDYLLGLWLLVGAAVLQKLGVFPVSILMGVLAVIILGKKLKKELGI